MSKFSRLVELYGSEYDSIFIHSTAFESGEAYKRFFFDVQKPSDILGIGLDRLRNDFNGLEIAVRDYGATILPKSYPHITTYMSLLDDKEAFLFDYMKIQLPREDDADVALENQKFESFTELMFGARNLIESIEVAERSDAMKSFDSKIYDLSQLSSVMRPANTAFGPDQEVVSTAFYNSILANKSSLILTRDHDVRRLTKVATRNFSLDEHCKSALLKNPVSVLCLPHNDTIQYHYEAQGTSFRKVFKEDAHFLAITSSDVVLSDSQYESVGAVFETYPDQLSELHYNVIGVTYK